MGDLCNTTTNLELATWCRSTWRTWLPRNMKLLCECHGCIIIGQFPGLSAISCRKCNAIVDVQNTGSSARRPDNGRWLNAVFLGIDVPIGPLGPGNSRASWSLWTDQSCTPFYSSAIIWGTNSLGSCLGEEIAGDKSSSHTGVKTCPSMIGSIHNRVLKASWILQTQMDLTLLSFVRLQGSGADISLKAIKTKCHDL